MEIQLYATWIFYALLNDLCADVAVALNQPLEQISLEMVFRGLYHFHNFQRRGQANDVIEFLATHAKRLGLIKAKRPRQKQRDILAEAIWGIPEPIPECP